MSIDIHFWINTLKPFEPAPVSPVAAKETSSSMKWVSNQVGQFYPTAQVGHKCNWEIEVSSLSIDEEDYLIAQYNEEGFHCIPIWELFPRLEGQFQEAKSRGYDHFLLLYNKNLLKHRGFGYYVTEGEMAAPTVVFMRKCKRAKNIMTFIDGYTTIKTEYDLIEDCLSHYSKVLESELPPIQ